MKTMHSKSDSDVTTATSIELSSPPRSPPRRLMYYVQSPSHNDVEKVSLGSSLQGSPHHPHHHRYHSASIQHSRESSVSRPSISSMKNQLYKYSSYGHGKKLHFDDEMDDEGFDRGGNGCNVRLCFCSAFWFFVLFFVFSISLWGASLGYKPKILVKHIVFHSFNIQAGMDKTGVPTDMLSLNSTVGIFYKNPATFFGVHVSSTPAELYYYELKVASGQMEKFYEPRKNQRVIVTKVVGHQVPVYGGLTVLEGYPDHLEKVQVPLNLTFTIRSKALILGQLVKSKFYNSIMCSVTLRSNNLGKPHSLSNSCRYR